MITDKNFQHKNTHYISKERILWHYVPEKINIMTGRELQLQYNHSSSPGNISIVRIAPIPKSDFKREKKTFGKCTKLIVNLSKSSPQRQRSDNHIQKWIQKDYLQNPVFEQLHGHSPQGSPRILTCSLVTTMIYS